MVLVMTLVLLFIKMDSTNAAQLVQISEKTPLQVVTEMNACFARRDPNETKLPRIKHCERLAMLSSADYDAYLVTYGFAWGKNDGVVFFANKAGALSRVRFVYSAEKTEPTVAVMYELGHVLGLTPAETKKLMLGVRTGYDTMRGDIWCTKANRRFVSEVKIDEKRGQYIVAIMALAQQIYDISYPLDKINNVEYEQGVIARLLGYGTVHVQSASQSYGAGFKLIANPARVKAVIESALENKDEEKNKRLAGYIGEAVGDVVKRQ